MTNRPPSSLPRSAAAHTILIAYVFLALSPVLLIVINSLKTGEAILRSPLSLPDARSFSLAGYQAVFSQSDIAGYFQNSLIVTATALAFVLLFGAMAAFALSEYRFRGNSIIGLYLVLGIMIPIRLGSVSILQAMLAGGLVNTPTALVLVYTAQGLPLAVFILADAMRRAPRDLKDAGRIDGLSEYVILFRLVLPLLRPALVAVAIFTMLPIWNDLWFPLILAPAPEAGTLTLGILALFGQSATDWSATLAALSLASLPVAEFAPRKIKLSVVGTGTADKTQIMFMVKRLLPRAGEMKEDAADALACAICAAHHLPLEMKRGAA